jgi:FAD/FMN-containing dehydrogenase
MRIVAARRNIQNDGQIRVSPGPPWKAAGLAAEECLLSSTPTLANTDPAAAADLAALIGADYVGNDIEALTFFSADLDERGPTLAAVVRPRDVAMLATAVRFCRDRGLAMIPRGGGWSYTGGYRPIVPDSVMFDMRGFDRILEINETDMYVVVETGCTWQQLYAALKAKGLRTPYFGPMSGYSATIGGALSQGSLFLGSSQYGLAADSALALEVVIADGTVLKTGSWGATNDMPPHMRSYGPDLTGLFLGDTGALGFKTKAVLRLIPFPPHQQYASFAFTEEFAAVAAISAVGRANVAAECYCWDPYFARQMSSASTGLADDLKFLAGVAKGGSSRLKGLFNAARVASAGRRAFGDGEFLLHVICDDVSAAGAAGRIAVARKLALGLGGREMPPSAPLALRGTPFTDFNSPERRVLQRNLPTNGLTVHSRIQALSRETRALIARYQPDFDRLAITCGVIYFAVGTTMITCEPIVYFDDEHYFQHDRVAEHSDVAALARIAEPEAAQVATRFREELTAIMTASGCGHVQIGKHYAYRGTRAPESFALLTAIKRAVDPDGLINPGSLGLAMPLSD